MTIDEWKEKQKMNKGLCDWFKGLAPEEKKAFWNSPQQAEQSRKAMDAEIMNANKAAISADSLTTPSNTMTMEQFDRMTPREQMDYCLNGGQIKHHRTLKGPPYARYERMRGCFLCR